MLTKNLLLLHDEPGPNCILYPKTLYNDVVNDNHTIKSLHLAILFNTSSVASLKMLILPVL